MQRNFCFCIAFLAALGGGCQPSDVRAVDTDPKLSPSAVPVRLDKLVAVVDTSFVHQLNEKAYSTSPQTSIVTLFIGGVSELSGTLSIDSREVVRQLVVPLSHFGSRTKGVVVVAVFRQEAKTAPKWISLHYRTSSETINVEALGFTDIPNPRLRYAAASGIVSLPTEPVAFTLEDLELVQNPDLSQPNLVAVERVSGTVTGYRAKVP